MSLILLLSMKQNSFPFICKHVSFRRYSEINIYDFKNDESYIIDEEAYALLKLLDGDKFEERIIINEHFGYTYEYFKQILLEEPFKGFRFFIPTKKGAPLVITTKKN